MSRKPNAALSAGLVAVKGAAAPAPDMPGRAGSPAPEIPAEADPGHQAPTDSGRIGEARLSPLNFRIPASFRREFKTYAARHDMKLNELLRRSFEAYRRLQGD
jgi:hypothetical protein